MSEAIPKQVLFERLGYGPPFDLLEQALEDEGLSRRSKANIAPRKADAARSLFRRLYIAVCTRGDCHAAARAVPRGRLAVSAATQAGCEICGGSPTALAVDEMVAAWKRAGLKRLCVVGGSPNAHRELEAAVGGRLDLRLIDGTTSRTASVAKSDLAWADRVAVWGGTILSHKVSSLYKGQHVVQLAKRGIQVLAAEMKTSVES